MNSTKVAFILNILLFITMSFLVALFYSPPERYDFDSLPSVKTGLLVSIEKTYNLNEGLDYAIITPPNITDTEESVLITMDGKSYINCDKELMRGIWVLYEVGSNCFDSKVVSVKGTSSQRYHLELNKPIVNQYKTNKYDWKDQVGYLIGDSDVILEYYEIVDE